MPPSQQQDNTKGMSWTVTYSTDDNQESSSPPNKAIVVILGYWGAKQKHLMKYSQLYTSLDIDSKNSSINSGTGNDSSTTSGNIVTVAGVASSSAVFWYDKRWMRQFATIGLQHVWSILQQQQSKEGNTETKKYPPIIFHIMSNGGVMVWEQMESLLSFSSSSSSSSSSSASSTSLSSTSDVPNDIDYGIIRRQVMAQIYDSAPAYPDWKCASGALTLSSGLGPPPGTTATATLSNNTSNPQQQQQQQRQRKQGWMSYLMLMSLKTIMYIFFEIEMTIKQKILHQPTILDTLWDGCCDSSFNGRQAFIYSTADSVTDCHRLEQLIDVRRQRWNEKNKKKAVADFTVKKDDDHDDVNDTSSWITTLKFDDSEHVMHYRTHPDRYRQFVQRILDQVLQQSSKNER